MLPVVTAGNEYWVNDARNEQLRHAKAADDQTGEIGDEQTSGVYSSSSPQRGKAQCVEQK